MKYLKKYTLSLFILLFLYQKASISASCTADNLVGEWQRVEDNSGSYYEYCDEISPEKGDHCSPSILHKHGWTGHCAWRIKSEFRISFIAGTQPLRGAKKFTQMATGQWQGRANYSGRKGFDNSKEIFKCQEAERSTLAANLIFRNDKIEQEVTESSDAKVIGSKAFFTCTMNGSFNQMILRFNGSNEDEDIGVYTKK